MDVACAPPEINRESHELNVFTCLSSITDSKSVLLNSHSAIDIPNTSLLCNTVLATHIESQEDRISFDDPPVEDTAGNRDDLQETSTFQCENFKNFKAKVRNSSNKKAEIICPEGTAGLQR